MTQQLRGRGKREATGYIIQQQKSVMPEVPGSMRYLQGAALERLQMWACAGPGGMC